LPRYLNLLLGLSELSVLKEADCEHTSNYRYAGKRQQRQ